MLLSEGICVSWGDSIGYLLENYVVENPISHIDDSRERPILLDPLNPVHRTHQLKSHLHVVDDAGLRNWEATFVSRHEYNLNMWLQKLERIMVVWPEHLESFAISRVVEFSVGQDPINVKDEDSWSFSVHSKAYSDIESVADTRRNEIFDATSHIRDPALLLGAVGKMVTIRIGQGSLDSPPPLDADFHVKRG
jgi:hypothetical protein